MKTVKAGSVTFSNKNPFVLIGGPCVLESEKLALSVGQTLKKISKKLKIPYVFKSSYDKANRSSLKSFRGPGLYEGLDILHRIKAKLNVPVLTDIHSEEEAYEASKVVDIIQIPAFLCRQTNLLLTAGKTGAVVNVKKGQFMAPWDMKNVIQKIETTGNKKILVTDRGASFGYNNLVADMRGLEVMKSFGYPVIYDATHSVQLPGGLGKSSGGQREFVWPLARAAVGLGVSSLFMEIHPKPEAALSDGPNSARLKDVEGHMKLLCKLDKITKSGV